ncbi:MAG: S1C family serine protease [Acidimicrobiales bacterium]
MSEAFREFDESFDDDDGTSPLLPPEDRIWRHPSEIASQPPALVAEVSAARERWLSRTPTRAGAWSAGVVGAVLATGVVLGGTHLTVWLGRPAPATARTVSTTLAPAGVQTVTSPGMGKIAAIVRAGLTVVHVSKQAGSVTGNGVVMSADGKILVPLELVASSLAIAVTTADGAVYAGRVVGSDAASQLAVVSIDVDGNSAFAPLSAASDSAVLPGAWLGVEWSGIAAGEQVDSVLSFGSVSSFAAASSGGTYQLLNAVSLQARDLANAPVGTVLVNNAAQLLGIVTERSNDNIVEVPGSLAEAVGQQIVAHGRVIHGWLGIKCKSTFVDIGPMAPTTTLASMAVTNSLPSAVEVVDVDAGTAAAAAGLRAGDVIEAVNGRAITSMQALQDMLYVLPPHTDVILTIQRGSSVGTVEASLQPAA